MTREPLDFRLAPVALATWSASALALGWSVTEALAASAALLLGAAAIRFLPVARPHQRAIRLVFAVLIVTAGAVAAAGLRSGAVASSPLQSLARQQAFVTLTGTAASDPIRKQGRFAAYVVMRLQASGVQTSGASIQLSSPLLVIGPVSWMSVHLGDELTAEGHLQAPQSRDLAGVLIADGDPLIIRRADWLHQGIGTVRKGLVESASGLPPAERSLVPALVDGDVSTMPPDVTGDFQTTGLTHLLAVSGSNLTLVLAFVLFTARWCGVRAVGLTVTGLVTVVFFVLLARPEPSVLRAAAMGVVGLVGLSSGGRRRGVRVLSVAVTVLVLFDPWLARSVGFLLSTLATAGILLLAPLWRDAMAAWMPRRIAEAVAVPLSAQIVCTPAIAAISGKVSLVAVFANLAAAPAVGPTTVVGLIGGLVAVLNATLGHVLGWVAGLPARWIIAVATHGAAFEGASLSWPLSPLSLVALVLFCLCVVTAMRALISRRYAALLATAALVAIVLRPIGQLGWPPAGWLMVACDVGQGDGLVLNAAPHTAVVVDTGPDPIVMDRCLTRLGITNVPLVVLTHFHADHVDGLPGVLDGRRVGEIETSPLADPLYGAEAVARQARAASVPTTVAVTGETRTVGQLHWQVLGPIHIPTPQLGDDSSNGSPPNNASVVMLLRVQGVRVLLSGDAEQEEQGDILATGVDLGVDVLKVAHHGSENQDPAYVFATRAPLAVISVGADNLYGHPAPQTLGLLDQLGAQTYRTDLNGDVAVIDEAGQLSIVSTK